uniref:RNase H domain-containing protein n=1 Tax=Strongyloides papillosus TaxID=174720 RepID=A0A0N5C9K9_STREA
MREENQDRVTVNPNHLQKLEELLLHNQNVNSEIIKNLITLKKDQIVQEKTIKKEMENMFNVLTAKIDQLKICSDVSSNTTSNSLSTGSNDSIFTKKNKFDSMILNSSVDVNMNCYEYKESFRKTSDLVLTEMLEQHDAVLSAIGGRISMNNKKVAAIVILTKNEIWCGHFKLGSNSLDDYMELKAFAEMMNYASIKFRNKNVNVILTSDYVFKFLQNRHLNFCLAYLGKGIRAELGKQILEAEKKFLSFKYTVTQSPFVTNILNDTGILGSVEGSINDLQVYLQRYEKFSNYF